MHKIQTEAQRSKLHPRREPYWVGLDQRGRHLGFRRSEKDGSWIARLTDAGARTYHALGPETDLTFAAAVASAVEWFEQEAGPTPSKITIADACSARLTRLHAGGHARDGHRGDL